MSRRPHARPTGGLPRVAAEVSLVLVHVAVIIGFSRLYSGRSFMGPLLAFVLVSHALAIAGRRWSIPAPVLALVALLATALVAAWTLFPGSTAFGLPTRGTWNEAVAAMREARTQFADVLAPVAPIPGFQLGAGLALVVAVWFADWTAFRLRISIEAVAPAGVLFVFASVLGSGEHQLSSTVAFAVTVLVFLAAQRAVRAQAYQAWLADAPTSGPRALVRAGGTVAVLAVLAGSLLGPRLPGADSSPVVDWRERAGGDSSRVTVSPMVELRKRLVDQSNTELFTVTSNRPAYWRLTSLDRFDGNIWSSSGTFSKAGERLPSDAPDFERSRIITQTVRIQGLSTIWVPAAFEARGITSSAEPLRWDSDSSTLIVDSSAETSDGLDYIAVSEVPELRPRILSRDPGRDSADIDARYSDLPADFPAMARDAARTATEGATNRYQQARMLQDWFRTRFRYSLAVSAGHSDDALVSFLRSRSGYCEQFAGAYAAMARSLGIPARVAVGFTPGLQDDGKYHVLGRHAHAWPEIWFPDTGWVPFEPTPGRGIPDGESHTGVPPAQDDTPTPTTMPPIVTSGPSISPSSVPGAGSPGTTRPGVRPPTAGLSSGTPTDDDRSLTDNLALAGAVAVVGLAIWVLVLLVVPAARRRRRRLVHARSGASTHVLDAWHDALGPVRWATGLRPAPAETYGEFAARASDALGALAAPLRQLADLVTEASWSPVGTPATVADRADGLAAELHDELGGRDSRYHRLRRRLSWREAFDRPK